MSDDRDRPADEPSDAPAPEPAAEDVAQDATPTCRECGAALADDQTYCLECGAPTPRAPKLSRGGRAGLVLAGALVVFGLGAGALAYAVMNEDDGRPGTVASTVVETGFPTATDPFTIPTDVVTGPLPPDTSGFPIDTLPTDTGDVPTDPFPPDTTGGTGTDDFPIVTEQPSETETDVDPDPDPGPDPPDTGDTDWPAGETAWTAIVSSTTSESEARSTADRLASNGEESGVLYSSDHPGLRAGYWVVFSGSFGSRSEAAAHARALANRFPGAYPRHIEG